MVLEKFDNKNNFSTFYSMQLRKVANPSFGSYFCQAVKLFDHFSRSWLSYRLEAMCLPSSRLFGDRKVANKNLEDILNESKEKKVKDHYPVLGKRRHNQKAPLGDLIRELKGEPIQNSTKPPVYKVKEPLGTKDISYVSKNNSARRVSILNKHFDLHSFQQKKDIPSLHKQKRIKFVPDDTEVGELLKSLISKGKFREVNVKEIMANIKPAVSEKNMKGKSDKDMSLTSQRVRPFTRRSKLFDGPQSCYFDANFNSEKHSSEQIFASIHELKWKEIVNSTVPKLGPTNAFEILMLEADKLWKFPIDNEIGLDDENQSTFEDHVFLNEYLEIFTMKGQIRRFMELVIIGLQQNPYLSVKEKVDKIYWFKDYFDTFSDDDLEF